MQGNDFRYVFFGIQSPDENVLGHQGKAQNRRISFTETVRPMTPHGIIVNGGFIRGFDSETEHTVDRMAGLIEETDIATAMLGTLPALPNSRLSRRLSGEGLLFAGGMTTAELTVDIFAVPIRVLLTWTLPYAMIGLDPVAYMLRGSEYRLYGLVRRQPASSCCARRVSSGYQP